jgi:hypothetical protein
MNSDATLVLGAAQPAFVTAEQLTGTTGVQIKGGLKGMACFVTLYVSEMRTSTGSGTVTFAVASSDTLGGTYTTLASVSLVSGTTDAPQRVTIGFVPTNHNEFFKAAMSGITGTYTAVGVKYTAPLLGFTTPV